MSFKDTFYEMKDVRKHEDFVIKFLNFRLSYFTTFSVLEVLLKNGIIFNYELNMDAPKLINKDIIKRVNKVCFKLLTNFAEDINYVIYNHIDIAFSCIVLAKDILKFKETFNPELEALYNLKTGNFAKCYNYLDK